MDYDYAKPYIPIFVSSFKAFDKLDARSFVYIDESRIELSPSQDIMYFDVEIYGQDGVLDAYYKRFGAKRVRSKEQIHRIQAEITGIEINSAIPEEDTFRAPNRSNIKELSQRNKIEQDICATISEMLGISAEDIDKNKEFYELGLDSKGIISMVEEIENKMNIKLYPTLLFEYTNVEMLAEYIEKEHMTLEVSESVNEEESSALCVPIQMPDNNTSSEDLEFEASSEYLCLKDKNIRDNIREDIKSIIAELAGSEKENIDTEKEFYELGLDSKDIIDMVERLENKMEIKLYPTLLFEYTNIDKLAEYIQNEFGDSYRLSFTQERVEENGFITATGNEEESVPKIETDADFLYRTRWIPCVLEQEYNGIRDKTENLLIICSEAGKELADAITLKYETEKVYRIILSDMDDNVGEQAWKVNAHRQEAIRNKIEDIGNVDRIIFLGAIQPTGYSINDMEMYHNILRDGLLSFFRTVKSFIELKRISKVKKVTVVTNHVWPVFQTEVSWPFSGSIWGFVKSFSKEYPSLEVNMMDMDIVGNEVDIYGAAECIIREPSHKNGEEIAFREGVRYKRVIEPVSIENQNTNAVKKNGVYIIFGGTGGLGLETAKYLACNYNVKLVLISRSLPNDMQKQKIEEIKEAGSEVVHIKADVSDCKSLENAIIKAKSLYGRINGCIHSALVLKDKSVKNMTEKVLLEVISPKAAGTVALFNVLKDEKLDFLLFYSSAQSFMGSLGQANYAAACTSKDAIAVSWGQRVDYPVSIINWGYWGSIGVVASDEYRERITAEGIDSIEPLEGMKIVSSVLSRQVDQLLAIKLSERHLKVAGIKKEDRNEVAPIFIPSVLKEISEKTALSVSSTDLLDRNYDCESWSMFERIQQCMLLKSFRAMGVFVGEKEKTDKDKLMTRLGIIKSYGKLYSALLDILERAGFIKIDRNSIEVLPIVESKEFLDELNASEKELKNLKEKYNQISPYCELLEKCVQAYPEVLTGRKSHMAVMFPSGSTHLVENIYRGNAITDFYNSLVADIIERYVSKRIEDDPSSEVHILEVGAGTGGTSVFVAKALKKYAKIVKYYYTDIALQFTRCNDMEFKEEYNFIEFGTLNIEESPLSQGFERNCMDIVFASNVLHATSYIQNSLANVKQLLKTNGLFIVNEATELNDFVTLTFGLTSGWWLYKDDVLRIPNSPLLLPEQWVRVSELCGFKSVNSFELRGKEKERAGQTVIVCESDGYVKNEKYFLYQQVKQQVSCLKKGKVIDEYSILLKKDKVSNKLINNSNIKMLHIFDLKYPKTFLTYWKRLRDENKYPLGKNFTYFLEDYGESTQVLKGANIREKDILCESNIDGQLLHKLVDTDRAKNMEVVMAGKGEPIVLISGFGFSAPQWYYQFKELSKRYRLIYMGIPGMGLSEGAEDVSLEGISQDFINILSELGVYSPVHVIGSSWGGLVAQTLAKNNPQRVASVILSCSFYSLSQKVGSSLQNKFRKDFDNEHDRKYLDIILDGEYVNYNLMSKYVKHFNNRFSTKDIIKDIRCPTLIITGKRDTVINDTQSRYMHKNIEGSQMIEIEESGHVPNLTRYEEFNKIIASFISKSKENVKDYSDTSVQNDLTAYCGANCRMCPSYIAKIKNSDTSKVMARTFWKKYLGNDIEDNIVCDA